MAVFVQRQLRDEREAPGPVAHAVLVVLYQLDRLDPMNGTNDRTVAVSDLGRVGDIPDIGFEVRGTPPHAQPEAVVIAAIAQALHGNRGTLRLNFEADQLPVVGVDFNRRLPDTSGTFVVHKDGVDFDVVPRHGGPRSTFDYLGGKVTIPVRPVVELHVSGVRRGR